VRLRIEAGTGRVRLLAGGREYFSAPLSAIGEKALPSHGLDALALRAWGGDLEIREVRCRF
jgi:hypothetical protein